MPFVTLESLADAYNVSLDTIRRKTRNRFNIIYFKSGHKVKAHIDKIDAQKLRAEMLLTQKLKEINKTRIRDRARALVRGKS